MIEVKTHCDMIIKVKELLTCLGIDFIEVYFRDGYAVLTDREPCFNVPLGFNNIFSIIMGEADNFSMFAQTQTFFFNRVDEDE